MTKGSSTSKWVFRHSVNLFDIGFLLPSVDTDLITEEWQGILAFHPNLDAIFLSNKGHFFCYDFNSGASQSIVIHGDPSDMLFRVFPFSECLRFLANANQNGWRKLCQWSLLCYFCLCYMFWFFSVGRSMFGLAYFTVCLVLVISTGI